MKKQKPAENFRAQKYIYALIGVVVFCIAGSIYKKKRVEQALQARAYQSAQEKLKNHEALTPSERASLGQSPSAAGAQPWNPAAAHYSSGSRVSNIFMGPSAQEITDARSKESAAAFTKETYLNVPLPANFAYSKLDIGDGFEGIYGENDHQKAKLTGIAYNKLATPEQVTEFLKTDADSIPNISKNPVQFMSNAEKLPPPPEGSGLGHGTIWNGKLSNGDSVAAVYIPRADGKGSYLFVLSGPEAYFENNDGSFDSVYEKAQAIPAQPNK